MGQVVASQVDTHRASAFEQNFPSSQGPSQREPQPSGAPQGLVSQSGWQGVQGWVSQVKQCPSGSQSASQALSQQETPWYWQ
jgi:hypothetical protein